MLCSSIIRNHRFEAYLALRGAIAASLLHAVALEPQGKSRNLATLRYVIRGRPVVGPVAVVAVKSTVSVGALRDGGLISYPRAAASCPVCVSFNSYGLYRTYFEEVFCGGLQLQTICWKLTDKHSPDASPKTIILIPVPPCVSANNAKTLPLSKVSVRQRRLAWQSLPPGDNHHSVPEAW